MQSSTHDLETLLVKKESLSDLDLKKKEYFNEILKW